MEDKVGNGRTEGRFTGAIESQTSKIPSAGYLAAAFGAIATSAILKIAGKDDWALFVGQWPAAFMLMGHNDPNKKVEAKKEPAKPPHGDA